MDATQTLEKAETILTQLGGKGCLSAMIGAHTFVGSEAGSVQFRFRAKAKDGINFIRVTLRGDDTYRLELLRLRGIDSWTKADISDLHAADLRRIIEARTGLYLSL